MRLSLMIAVFIFAAAFGRAANAAGLPTVDELRAKITTAAGKVPPSRYMQIRYTRSGTSGTETSVYSGDDFRVNDVYGPLQTAYGRYGDQRVTALRLNQPLAIDDPGTIRLDVRLGSQVPLTTVAINNAVGERFLIDTGGGGGTLLIFDYFARRYPQALVDRGGGNGRRVRMTGVGGSIDIRPYQLDQVKIGSVQFKDFVGYRVMERKSYEGTMDGLIGTQLLHFFNVWLDYPDSQIFLVPNSVGRRAMH